MQSPSMHVLGMAFASCASDIHDAQISHGSFACQIHHAVLFMELRCPASTSVFVLEMHFEMVSQWIDREDKAGSAQDDAWKCDLLCTCFNALLEIRNHCTVHPPCSNGYNGRCK